jgi:hypothetical protein
MRIHNDDILDKLTPSMAASWESSAMWVGHVANMAIQIVFAGGGSPVGTFKLQASCDPGKPNKEADQGDSVVNWDDITSQSQAVSDDGSVLFNVVDPGFQWIRIVWTNTSGTATISSARLNTKGI